MRAGCVAVVLIGALAPRLPAADAVGVNPSIGAPPAVPSEVRPSSAPAPDIDTGGSRAVQRERKLRDAVEGLGTPDEDAAARAYRILESNFDSARPLLHSALQHKCHRVRMNALKLLGERGASRDDLSAVGGSLRDNHATVRRLAILAVRSLGSAGLPFLLERLREEKEPANRRAMIQTLRLWNDRRAVVPLVELLGRDRDEDVRVVCADALTSLTGQKLGTDAPAWWEYLAEERSQQDRRLTRSSPPPAPPRQPAPRR